MATQETRAELITIVVAMFDAAPGVAVIPDQCGICKQVCQPDGRQPGFGS